MARFLQLFAFAGVILALVYNKQDTKIYKMIFFGFVIAIFPYMALNQALYHNALLPFINQVFLTAGSGWLNHEPLSYYFIGLFRENFLYPLFIAGIFLSFRKPSSRLVIFPLAFFFLFFSLIKQKEMRFLIILMPYMLLLASYALFRFAEPRKHFKKFMPFLMLLLFAFSAIKITTDLASESEKTNKYSDLRGILEKSSGNIWISSPVIAAESGKRIHRLVYYPVFGRDLKLIKESDNADFIFIDMCDLECKPNDADCLGRKKDILSYFRQKFAEVYSSDGECRQFVFRR
jgi:hypothetical protein